MTESGQWSKVGKEIDVRDCTEVGDRLEALYEDTLGRAEQRFG